METEDHQQQIIACNPRPDITELTCSCKTIINESQMNYVMQKFSGLESIYVSFDPDGGNTLANFLLHIIRNIPIYSLQIVIDTHIVPDLFDRLMKENNLYKNIILDLQTLSYGILPCVVK